MIPLRLLSILAAIFILLATAPARAQQPRPLEPAEIRLLIKQLGDHSYRVREAAMDKLRNAGAEVLIPLGEAAQSSDDLEIRTRAKKLSTTLLDRLCRSQSTGARLVLIPAGKFKMGSPESEAMRRDDETLHEVQLSRSFLMGKYEVSQQEYEKVTGRNPSWFRPQGGGNAKLDGKETLRFPVEFITWFDAIDFCNQLSQKDGLPPYYKLSDVQRAKQWISAAEVKILGGNGYRLPTEAEWEYACRSGADGDKMKDDLVGNFQRRQSTAYGLSSTVSLPRTTYRGSYPANKWGLHDMHGNVSEWCWDWYDSEYYEKSPAVDPMGPDTGKHRVVRGGSWRVKNSSCRSATRFWQLPGRTTDVAGFRIARFLSAASKPAE